MKYTTAGGLILIAVLALTVSGCGRGHPRAATDLTIRAVNSSVGRSAFHLQCAPAGGDLPNPARACAALAAQPQLVTHPKPFVCHGGPFSWWDVTISGRLNGKRIHRAFSTCWTPQMATLGHFGMSDRVLQKHLLRRRHEIVLAGAKHLFPPGVLRPADLITCDIRGHHLSVGVPTVAEQRVSTGYNGKNTVAVNLTVTRHSDGSATAACLIVR